MVKGNERNYFFLFVKIRLKTGEEGWFPLTYLDTSSLGELFDGIIIN